jgi:hypothetical protein
MKRFRIELYVVGICAAFASTGFAQPNDLFNPKFAEGINGWHGIGQVVYLKSDGKESLSPVPGAVPVLKIPLKPTESREISQEFTTVGDPTQLHMHLELKASPDFKNNVAPAGNSDTWKSVEAKGAHEDDTSQSDFCVRLGPDSVYRTANATRKWTTLDYTFKHVVATRYRAISFCVPCGTGSIYVRNTLVAPLAANNP